MGFFSFFKKKRKKEENIKNETDLSDELFKLLKNKDLYQTYISLTRETPGWILAKLIKNLDKLNFIKKEEIIKSFNKIIKLNYSNINKEHGNNQYFIKMFCNVLIYNYTKYKNVQSENIEKIYKNMIYFFKTIYDNNVNLKDYDTTYYNLTTKVHAEDFYKINFNIFVQIESSDFIKIVDNLNSFCSSFTVNSYEKEDFEWRYIETLNEILDFLFGKNKLENFLLEHIKDKKYDILNSILILLKNFSDEKRITEKSNKLGVLSIFLNNYIGCNYMKIFEILKKTYLNGKKISDIK